MIKYLITESQSTVNDTLNPKIWNEDNTLKDDVKETLFSVVDEYIKSSDIITDSDIIDIELLGSNANYNYTDKSDIDLHLVVNMEDICQNTDLAQTANNLEKTLFNAHYDIKIRGLEVEVYVEDVHAGTMSNGIYSLKDDKWIKFPVKTKVVDLSDDEEYINTLLEWSTKANNLISNVNTTSAEIKNYIDSIYNLRRLALMTDGEYSVGNLVFKQIRNDGLLQKLKDLKYELASKELSLESHIV